MKGCKRRNKNDGRVKPRQKDEAQAVVFFIREQVLEMALPSAK